MSQFLKKPFLICETRLYIDEDQLYTRKTIIIKDKEPSVSYFLTTVKIPFSFYFKNLLFGTASLQTCPKSPYKC